MGIGLGGRLGLGPGREVEPLQDGGGLEAAGAVELAARAVHDDEGRHGLHAVACRHRLRPVDVDRLDRISLAAQLVNGRAHLLARAAPFGVEVEQDRVGCPAIG